MVIIKAYAMTTKEARKLILICCTTMMTRGTQNSNVFWLKLFLIKTFCSVLKNIPSSLTKDNWLVETGLRQELCAVLTEPFPRNAMISKDETL